MTACSIFSSPWSGIWANSPSSKLPFFIAFLRVDISPVSSGNSFRVVLAEPFV